MRHVARLFLCFMLLMANGWQWGEARAGEPTLMAKTVLENAGAKVMQTIPPEKMTPMALLNAHFAMETKEEVVNFAYAVRQLEIERDRQEQIYDQLSKSALSVPTEQFDDLAVDIIKIKNSLDEAQVALDQAKLKDAIWDAHLAHEIGERDETKNLKELYARFWALKTQRHAVGVQRSKRVYEHHMTVYDTTQRLNQHGNETGTYLINARSEAERSGAEHARRQDEHLNADLAKKIFHQWRGGNQP